MIPTIYILTPSFNAVRTIDRTIQSVVSQAGNFRIRYHVQDGGSSDGTLERLEWWQERLLSKDFRRQAHAIRFSFTSAPDGGMYDALVRGFEAIGAQADAFITWINADDILMPGALAFAGAMTQQFTPAELSWFGGSVCIMREHMITLCFERPAPREALRRGLCDGKHWEFLQPKGTFFRAWLWRAVDPARNVATLRLAGDWNLWRLMAGRANFAQVAVPLGAFHISKTQMSARLREAYLSEIDTLLTETARTEAFRSLCELAPISRRRIQPQSGSQFKLVDVSADSYARHRWKARFGTAPQWGKRAEAPDAIVAVGREIAYTEVDPDSRLTPTIKHLVVRKDSLIAFDQDWQFPAITEKHAFQQITSMQRLPSDNITYIGYPWATLIDKLQAKAKDRDLHLDRFEEFCGLLQEGGRRVTVCQHIHGQAHANLFRQAGIDTVFWTHATHSDAVDEPKNDVRFLPFPLYPVQTPQALPEAAAEADSLPRKYLFSFIGARANQYYLTKARNWILDLLADDPRGLIVGRDSWHYQKIVYDLQIKKTASDTDTKALVDDDAAALFRASLVNSVFSLCPAGSGPNSIRLWESLGAGSIPVILADTWVPPGDRRLWEMAAIFCKETPEAIKALPDQLAAIAADPARLAQMRHAMRQLWLLYGPQNFVNDVLEFLLAQGGTQEAGTDMPVLAAPTAQACGPDNARHLLLSWSSRLLLEPAAALASLEGNSTLSAALEQACALVGTDALTTHFRAVLARARHGAQGADRLSAPASARGAVPKIAFLGRHARRTPLSYPALRRVVGDRLAWVEQPAEADLVVTGFNLDWRENIDQMQSLLAQPKAPKLAVISEEPLWDVTWSGPFTGRDGQMTVNGTDIRYTFLGHETSDIYRFERLPYFVLTEDHYVVRYASMMARFAGMTPDILLKRWQSAPVSAAFFAEKREGETYAGSFPERDVTRLSTYRSDVAALSQGTDVLRVGKGWGAEVRRQDLPDWHLDKLAQLDGRVRMASAYENVHQHNYISEKIFDAFAVGSVPVYWASPRHRIFDLVPATAMLNTIGLDAPEAAQQISGFTPDMALAESWLETCARLATLFGDFQAISNERRRVANAVVAEVRGLV